MTPRKQWIVVISFILFLDVVAIAISNVTGNIAYGEDRPFTTSELYDNALLGEYVYIEGRISKVLEDHTSEKGYDYQQFIMTDGEEEIKAFCSVKYGRSEAKEGDEIIFDGEFKKFYGSYEIYGFCSEVKII